MKKSTKVELVSAVAMLLVAAIMMTSASFAWYTLSTTPELSGVEMELGVSKNFEIAQMVDGTEDVPEVTSSDTGDETTWGAKVTSYAATSSKINYGIHVANSDAGCTDGKLCQIGYDNTGRTNGEYIELSTSCGAMSAGVVEVTANVSYPGIVGGVSKVVGVGYGVWLRSNVDISHIKATVSTENAWITTGGGAQVSSFTNEDGETVDVSDMITASVYVSSLAPQSNNSGSWTSWISGATPLVSGTSTEVSGLAANTQFPVLIVLSVDGEYLYARDYVESGAATFGGFTVTFESSEVTE